MKKYPYQLLALLITICSISACNQDEKLPIINPIIGEWTALGDQFLTLKVNGEEKSISGFGMEVLNTSEKEASQAAKTYLQLTFLGSIDIDQPKSCFQIPDV